MDHIVLYSVNIAMESTIALVLAILLITIFLQKNNFLVTTPLILLLSSTIIVLIVQIVTWAMYINDVPLKYGAMPLRIVYFLDYAFYYCVSIAMYYYVEAFIKAGYKQRGSAYRPQKKIRKMIIAWGVISTLIYSAMLFVPSVYRVENGEQIFSFLAYVIMHIMAKFAIVCSGVLVVRYRKVIGKRESVLILGFLIMMSVAVFIDELCGLCISYILVSVYVILIYVSMDLHKSLLLERQEKEIVEWKTQIMLSQIQPHFLYNVLTTISGLCEMQNASEARDVVNHFADYFRTNLESLGKEKTITFEKELEHVETYLWLEKVRFEDRLNICYDIQTTDFVLPSLTVQPIVENAVKHGIIPKDEAGTVTISTYETDSDYVIMVDDDGIGFDANAKPTDTNKHIGIENVSKRLEIMCNGSCEINSEIGKGTSVKIHIPKGDL